MSNKPLAKKIRNVRLLILDVDGVLTNGQFFLGPNGQEYKAFHAQDGYGLKQIQKTGIDIAIISGRQSASVSLRARELGIQHLFQNVKDKMKVLEPLLKRLDLTLNECAYVGDDTPDLNVMQQVGLACTVANATPSIKAIAHFETQRCGGEGAVREICDWLLCHQQQPLYEI